MRSATSTAPLCMQSHIHPVSRLNRFDACTRRVGRLKDQMAEICVRAVLSVADLERRDVNLDLIKV